MCCNKQLSVDQQARIDELSKCAVAILQGATVESYAKEGNYTVEDVNAMIEEIKAINPFLYQQIQDKFAN